MAARDNEKYFWWKKDKNYYSNHKLKALHKMKNGYVYSVLLEQIKCESTPYKGILKFSESRAYTIEELSAVTDMSVKMIKNGLDALKELELIAIDETGIITVKEFENCTGYETGGAKRKREFREQQNSGQMRDNLGTNEGQMSLESRDKNIDIRDKIIYLLSSLKIKYMELGFDKEFDEAEQMMIKAAIISNKIPSQGRIEQIMNDIILNDNLCNKQGYLVNCLKNEIN